MKLYDIKGRAVYKNVTKYLIDWDKKSRSKSQFEVKQFLKLYWEKYIVYEEFPVFGTRMKVDFVNATKKIAIEFQGEQHNEFNPHFHKYNMNFWLSIRRDRRKANWLEKNNFVLVELIKEDLSLLSPEFFEKKFEVYIR